MKGQFGDLMKQAQKVQEQMQKMQEELAKWLDELKSKSYIKISQN